MRNTETQATTIEKLTGWFSAVRERFRPDKEMPAGGWDLGDFAGDADPAKLTKEPNLASRGLELASDRWDSHIRVLTCTLMTRYEDESRTEKNQRVLAAWALGCIGPEANAAEPILTAALKDRNVALREKAAWALRSIHARCQAAMVAQVSSRDFGSETDRLDEWIARLIEILGRRKPAFLRTRRDDRSQLSASLWSMLRHFRIDDRCMAAWTLGKIGRDAGAAASTLADALKDKNAALRAEAADALAKIGAEAKKAVPALIVAVEDPSYTVRERAAFALMCIGGGRESVPALIRVAAQKEGPQTWLADFAQTALGWIGPDAVPDLIAALRNEDAKLRLGAVKSLFNVVSHAGGQTKATLVERAGPILVPALVQALRDPVADIRGYAAWALGKLGDEAKAAVPALTEALKDKSGWVCERSLDSLLELGIETEPVRAFVDAYRAAILKCFEDPDGKVRVEAAEMVRPWSPILGLDNISLYLPVLIRALKDKLPSVRSSVAKAIDELAARGDVPSPQLRPALEPLIEALKDASTEVVVASASAIGSMRHLAKEAVPALCEVLNGSDDEAREAVANALGRIGPDAKDAAFLILVALNSKSEEVRYNAAYALGRINPPLESAVPALIHALKDKGSRVVDMAAISLGLLGPGAESAVPALIESLKKDRLGEAARALGEIGPIDDTVVPALIQALNDGRTRYWAIKALGDIGPEAQEAVPALIVVWKSRMSDSDRNAAFEGLGKIDPHTLQAAQ